MDNISEHSTTTVSPLGEDLVGVCSLNFIVVQTLANQIGRLRGLLVGQTCLTLDRRRCSGPNVELISDGWLICACELRLRVEGA